MTIRKEVGLYFLAIWADNLISPQSHPEPPFACAYHENNSFYEVVSTSWCPCGQILAMSYNEVAISLQVVKNPMLARDHAPIAQL